MKTPESPKFTGYFNGAYFKDGCSDGITVKAEALGGEDVKEPEVPEVKGCDKIQHWLRSVAHSPNHLRVAKKIQKT